MSLCSLYESRRKTEMEKSAVMRKWRAKPTFEQVAWIEDGWRNQGELAIKVEMERRVAAWLLAPRQTGVMA